MITVRSRAGMRLRQRLTSGMAAAALIALGMFCFLSAASSFHEMDPFSKKISFVYTMPQKALFAGEAAERQEKGMEHLSAAWWQSRGIQELENQDTGRRAFAEILAVCGRTDLLFAHAPALDYDQTSLCLVGEKAASDLFGGRDVIGRTITYEDRSYEIAGVLTEAGNTFVYEAGKSEELSFQRAELRCENPAGRAIAKRKAEALFSPDAALDYSLLYLLAYVALLAVPAGVGVGLIKTYRSYGAQARPIGRLFWAAMCCLIVVCFFKMACYQCYIPVEFFPSKWSDFTFWQELLQQKRDGLTLFFSTELASCDRLFFSFFFKTYLWTAASLFCFSRAKKRLKGAGLWHHLY